MCVVSFVQEQIPGILDPYKIQPTTTTVVWPDNEFRISELERKVVELEGMIKRAKLYYIENDEPDCETEDKLALVRELCEELGIDPARLTE